MKDALSTRLQHHLRLLATLFSLLVLTGYWFSLENSHRYLTASTTQQTRTHATYLSRVAALQLQNMLHGLDFSLDTIASAYLDHGERGLNAAVRTTLAAYPPDSIVQISLADGSGQLRYSNLGLPNPAPSIADREHFKFHLSPRAPELYLSPPLFGRISQRWSIQLSRAIWQNGQLVGVLVLSLDPSYLATMLRSLTSNKDEIITLIRSDGSYLARTSDQTMLLGQRAPAQLPFLSNPGSSQGQYETTTNTRDIHIYSWQRLHDPEMVVMAELCHSSALLAVNDEIGRNRLHALLGSALLLLLVQIIITLMNRRNRQQQRVKTVYDALPVGVLIIDRNGKVIEGNQRAAELCGWPETALTRQPLDRLLHLDTENSLEQKLAATPQPQFAREKEILVSPPQQAPRWLAIKIAHSTTPGIGYIITLSDISDAHLAHEQLTASEQRLAMALQGAELSLWDINLETQQVHMGALSSAIIGITQTESAFPLATWEAHIHPLDLPSRQHAYEQHLYGQTPFYECRYRIRHHDGHWLWMLSRGKIMRRDEHGNALHVAGIHRDITQEVEAEALRQQWQQQLEKLTDQIPGVVYQYQLNTDGSSCFPFASPGIRDIYGVSAEQVRHDAAPIFDCLHPDDLAQIHSSIQQSAATLENWVLEYRVVRDTGTVRWLQGQAKPERLDDGGTLWHGYITDITSRKEAQDALQYLATTDTLTGLPNRRAFSQRAETELAQCVRHASHHSCIVMLDIDFFKHVNDSYGHAIGDLVLQQLATLLTASLRNGDSAGRLGGEEFAILLPITDLNGAQQYAERLRQQIAQFAFGSAGQTFFLTVSMGISAFYHSDPSLDTPLARADQALYQAKNSGRNRVCVHAPEATAMT